MMLLQTISYVQKILTLQSGWRAPYRWHCSPAQPTADTVQVADTRVSLCA